MTETILRTEALTFLHSNGGGIRSLSIELARGDVYGLIGRNGAGKTTTILCLLGFLRAAAGEISLLGFRGRHLPTRLRARIGYVPQQHVFYPWMRVHEVGKFASAFFPRWDHARFHSLLQRLAVDPAKRCRELSHGTLAKLSFAVACAHGAELLVLDEPTAGVDLPTRREILDFICDEVAASGITVLLSSHIAEDIERTCTKVGIIDSGSLVLEMGRAELEQRFPGKTVEDVYLSCISPLAPEVAP